MMSIFFMFFIIKMVREGLCDGERGILRWGVSVMGREGEKAVSYTHLDVYKRQIYCYGV